MIPLSPRLIVCIAILALLAGLSGAVAIQTKRLHASQSETAAVQAQFSVFVAQTKAIGEKAQADAEAKIADQKRINDETVKSYDARIGAVLDRYNKLLNKPALASAGSGAMPAVPDTASPVDDTARDQRLLEVLRAADLQTSQLIQLQEWIKAQR